MLNNFDNFSFLPRIISYSREEWFKRFSSRNDSTCVVVKNYKALLSSKQKKNKKNRVFACVKYIAVWDSDGHDTSRLFFKTFRNDYSHSVSVYFYQQQNENRKM